MRSPEETSGTVNLGRGDGFFFDAFLSYSHNDSLTVRKLVNRLQE